MDLEITAIMGDGHEQQARTFIFVGVQGNPEAVAVALIDTGAEVDAVVSRKWLERLKPDWAGMGTGPQLTVCGQGRLHTLGVQDIQLMVAGLNRYGENAFAILPAVHACVIAEELGQYQVLIGAKFLQRIEAQIDCARRCVVIGGRDDDSRITVPLAEPQLGLIATSTGSDLGPDPSEVAHELNWRVAYMQQALSDLNMEGLRKLREARWRKRRVIQTDRAASLDQDVAAINLDDVATRVEQEEAKRKELLLEAVSAEELERMRVVAEGWAQKVCNLAETIALEENEGIRQLDADQRQQLAEIFREAALQLCSASKVPRKPMSPLPVHVTLELTTESPNPTKEGAARTLSEDKRRAAVEQADILETAGLIERINNPDWIHAVVMARKPDGRFRFAIDYRPLNRSLRRHVYPLPEVDGLLRRLAQHKIYSVYDLSDAFWHLELEESDRHLTGFHVPGRGTYVWKVLPMGIQPATAAWQANMERVFAPLIGRGIEVFVDDIVLYADSAESLLELTREAHALMKKYDLRIGHKKAQLFKTEINFLGHRVRHGQIMILPEHQRAILEFPRPTTVEEMQRFLGLANYMRKFVPRMGEMTAQLVLLCAEQENPSEADKNRISNQHRKLQWNADAEKSFEDLRQTLAAPPVLTIPNMSKLDGRLRIESDACTETGGRPGGVGGTVWWRDDEGEWRLVIAHSRILQPAERKYAPVEVELLGVLDILRRADWLLGKASNVEVLTDHQALTFIAKIGGVEHGRHARWAARLLQHDLYVKYRPGSENTVNDALSRAPVQDLLRGGSLQQIATLEEKRAEMKELLAAEPANHYDVAFVDFPWTHESDPRQRYFRRMPNDAWAELGLQRVLSADAIVFIAVPDCLLPEGLKAVKALGLRFHRTIQWQKTSRTNSERWPQCGWEHVIIASRGKVDTLLQQGANKLDGAVLAATQQPGRKPEQLFELMEAMVRQGTKKIELFARRQRDGWTALGDEVDKFGGLQIAAVDDHIPVISWLHYARSGWDIALLDRIIGVLKGDEARLRWRQPTKEERRKVKQWHARHAATLQWRPQSVTRRDVRRFLADFPNVEPILMVKDEAKDWKWALWVDVADADDELFVPSMLCNEKYRLGREDQEGTEALLRMIHDVDLGHAGITRTLARLHQSAWQIPGEVGEIVRRYIAECEICQRHKPDHPRRAHASSEVRDMPAIFGHRLHVDLFGPNNRGEYVVSMTDAATRWPMARVLTDKTAASVAKAIHEDWLCIFGPPKELVTDQGAEFESTLIQELCAANGVDKLRTTPYHPQANGLEERAHRTIKGTMRRIADQLGLEGDWRTLLPLALRALRSARNRTTGSSPARLVLGQDLPLIKDLYDGEVLADARARQLVDVVVQGDDQARRELDALAQKRVKEAQLAAQIAWKIAIKSIDEASHNQRLEAAEELYPELVPGGYCRIYLETAATGEAGSRWSEVYRIVEKLRGVSVCLAAARDPLRRTVQSCMRVKPVRLADDDRIAFDELWNETQAQIVDAHELRKEAAKATWAGRDEAGGEGFEEVDKILEHRGSAKNAEVLVRWASGEETWEKKQAMKRQVPALVAEYDRAIQRESRARVDRNADIDNQRDRPPRRGRSGL